MSGREKVGFLLGAAFLGGSGNLWLLNFFKSKETIKNKILMNLMEKINSQQSLTKVFKNSGDLEVLPSPHTHTPRAPGFFLHGNVVKCYLIFRLRVSIFSYLIPLWQPIWSFLHRTNASHQVIWIFQFHYDRPDTCSNINDSFISISCCFLFSQLIY